MENQSGVPSRDAHCPLESSYRQECWAAICYRRVNCELEKEEEALTFGVLPLP